MSQFDSSTSETSEQYLEWGRAKDGSGDFFLAGPRGVYDYAVKGLSGDRVHILRVSSKQLKWLTANALVSMPEQEREYVQNMSLKEIEDEVSA